MVGVSSDDYKLWLNGLQLILQLGSVNVTRVRKGQKWPGGGAGGVDSVLPQYSGRGHNRTIFNAPVVNILTASL